MNHFLLALALQAEAEPDNSSMWIIIAVVLVILVFIVVIIGVGLTIFFIARKRSKARSAPPAISVSTGPGPSAFPAAPQAEVAELAAAEPPISESPSVEAETPAADPEAEAADLQSSFETADFDPSRTVAIVREPTPVSFGSIKFVSGILDGEEFDLDNTGAFIGRDSSLSQIVVNDPRISKRHLWIGVRGGVVTIVDQDSRNGTFVNDPKSERITEATLNSGDTVIMGESDVARFEYLAKTQS